MRLTSITTRKKRTNKSKSVASRIINGRRNHSKNNNYSLSEMNIISLETQNAIEDKYILELMSRINEFVAKTDDKKPSQQSDFLKSILNLYCENNLSEKQLENIMNFFRSSESLGIVTTKFPFPKSSGKQILRFLKRNCIEEYKHLVFLVICQTCKRIISYNFSYNTSKCIEEQPQCLCNSKINYQKVALHPISYEIASIFKDEQRRNSLLFIKSSEIEEFINSKCVPKDKNINPLLFTSLFMEYASKVITSCDYLLTFVVSVDGVAFYCHSRSSMNKGITPVSLLLLNQSLNTCLNSKSHHVFTITQSSISDNIMEYLFKEFKFLFEEGLHLYDKTERKIITIKAILLSTCCDYPEAAHQIRINNQVGRYFCRYCTISKSSKTKDGIKVCFSLIRKNKNIFGTKSEIPRIVYYNTKNGKEVPDVSFKGDIKIMLNKEIKINKKYIQNDFYTCYDLKKKELCDLKEFRETSQFGLWEDKSLYETYLPYFNIFKSTPLDWLHLYGNICDTLIEILFKHKTIIDNKEIMSNLQTVYKIDDKATKQDQYKQIPLFLSDEILSTMSQIITKINKVKYTNIGSYLYMMQELEYRHSSIYNRIYFFCKILPMLLEGYSEEDCLLIPIVPFLASFITKTLSIKREHNINEIKQLEIDALKIVSFMEVSLPSILLNTQIHQLLHIPENIYVLGSLRLYSTAPFERSYSVMKRTKVNRSQTSLSLLNKLILSEVLFRNKSKPINGRKMFEYDVMSDDNEWKYDRHKSLIISDEDIKVIYQFCIERNQFIFPFCNAEFDVHTDEKVSLINRSNICTMLQYVENKNIFIEPSFKPNVKCIDSSFICYYKNGVKSIKNVFCLQVQEIIKIKSRLFIIGKKFKSFKFDTNNLYGIIFNPNEFTLDYVIPIEWIIQSNLIVVDDGIYVYIIS
ncbi:hypothetical protein WA158_005897 [Blastocystis sp. Blastoise]